MNLSDYHISLLAALRGASVLTREPGPATPDGHERWFSLAQLQVEGRINEGGAMGGIMEITATQLWRARLVTRKTMHTVPYYSVTAEGLLALAAHEAGEGLSEIAACQMEVEQARYDVQAATRRSTRAERALEAAWQRHMERTVAP